MQTFFDAIDITTVFTGTEAYYLPPVDKVFMPSIARFQDPRNFYGVWAHELAHATKAPHRLNRDFGCEPACKIDPCIGVIGVQK